MASDRRIAVTTQTEEKTLNSAVGRILLVMENDTLTRYGLPWAESVRIGREEGCEIVLRDPKASRLHARLYVGDVLEIEDAGSRNGTRVQNEALEPNQRKRIRMGDSIQIGNAILIVQVARRADRHAATEDADEAGIVMRDPAMREVYALVERVAAGNINVLVVGETGVGKEVIAEAIHRHSGARSKGPYVRINCAAVTEQLFESELFGHERGSFTGALRTKPGLLEEADKGTVLLDEVGELSLTVQAKLLRVLESREVTRVGGLKPQPIDVRFVAATNRNLKDEVLRGKFREDLFFRLTGITVSVPPLRERVTEVEPLVRTFVASISSALERTAPRVSESAMQMLKAYAWPGNIRELRNAVECAVLRCDGSSIEPKDLPAEIAHRTASSSSLKAAGPSTPTAIPPADQEAPARLNPQQRAERERIVQALAACNGNQTRAAAYLGMPRRTLVAKLAAYDVPRPRKPAGG
jgi:DNA-binding NtrC family response regulator